MKNLLVVEDQPIVVQQIKNAVKEAGIEINVISAGDGVEGAKKFTENKVDVMLLDVHMPKMNGMDMLVQLSNTHQEKVKNCKIFVISTESGNSELKETAKGIGIEGWIIKPFIMVKFMEYLKENLKI